MGLLLLLLLDLGPGVLEADGAVDDEGLGGGVGVDAEVAEALELESVEWLEIAYCGLDLAVGQDLE